MIPSPIPGNLSEAVDIIPPHPLLLPDTSIYFDRYYQGFEKVNKEKQGDFR